MPKVAQVGSNKTSILRKGAAFLHHDYSVAKDNAVTMGNEHHKGNLELPAWYPA